MIGIELLRNEPDRVRDALAARGEHTPVNRVLDLDARRREAIARADGLRAHRNEVSRRLGRTKERPPDLIQEMRETGAEIKTLEEEIRLVETDIDAILTAMPNIPRDEVPKGEDETGNVVVKTVGEPPSFSFDPLPHWELAESLDIIDLKRGAKLSGSRFFVLKGKGARLQRALISWMLDLHTQEHGYEEVYLPNLVTTETATNSGQLPKFADTMYHDDEDDLWMIPTAEVPITGLYKDEILEPGSLPIYHVAHTPCFRRERAAAGRDTRGIKRVHQFEKVEMYKFAEPSESDAELASMVSNAEEVCRRLGVPYRVLQLCTGDLGFASVESYDIEMWAAGSGEWLEVSTCSNCTDFQSRRASIRYRPEAGARPRLVHTLNGSGIGLARAMIAVLENFQQADGSVSVPEVLRPYTGFDRIG